MDNSNSPRLKAGITLQSGKYRIISELGQGGFGITYLAEHQLFGEVALKELFINSGNAHCSREHTTQRNVVAHFDAEQFVLFKKRFTEEAKTLFTLNGIQGVVRVIDIFEENSTVYFSMEYLNGDKLEDYVKKRGRLNEAETLRILQQIGTTLAAVHEKKVLHRDIKPANIIITNDGRPFLIDFGIARTYAEDIGETHTTFHSPRYAPPEQKTAKSKMGTYSDVYALGATAYFMLTGEPPQNFEERIMGDYESPKSRVPNLSDTVNTAINESLEFRTEKRPQTAFEFLKRLNGTPTTPIVEAPRPIVSANTPPQYKTDSDATLIDNSSQKTPIASDNTLIQGAPQPKPNADATLIQQETPVVQGDNTLIQPPTPPKPNPRDLTDEQKRSRRIIFGTVGATVTGILIYWATLPPAHKSDMYVAPPIDTTLKYVPKIINTDSIMRAQFLADSLEAARVQDSINNVKNKKVDKKGKPTQSGSIGTTVVPPSSTHQSVPKSETPVPQNPVPAAPKPKTPVTPTKSSQELVTEHLSGFWQKDNLVFDLRADGSCRETNKSKTRSGSWLMSSVSENGTILVITVSNSLYKFKINNAFSATGIRLQQYDADQKTLTGKYFDKK